MLLDVFDKIIQLTATFVLDGVSLVIALDEVDGWESLGSQRIVIDLIGSGVHLGDNDIVRDPLELLSKCVPGGGCGMSYLRE